MGTDFFDGLVKTFSKTTKELGKTTRELGARAEQTIEAPANAKDKKHNRHIY